MQPPRRATKSLPPRRSARSSSSTPRLAQEAEALAAGAKFAEGAATYARAVEALASVESKARKLAGAVVAPPPAVDLVRAEMDAIERVLGQRQARAAVPRMTKTVVDLWKRHRRTRWSDLLWWIRQCRIRFPQLNEVGRYRLPALEWEVQEYIKQERVWNKTLQELKATAGLQGQIRKLESFIRHNYNSFYRGDAEARLEQLRDQAARRRPRR